MHIIEKITRKPVAALIVIGVVWLMFFDNDSVLYQFKLSKEIRRREMENRRLHRALNEVKHQLKEIDNTAYLEKYAREKLLLHKKDEDLYLIDTTRNEK